MKTTWPAAILLLGACLLWAGSAAAQDDGGPMGDAALGDAALGDAALGDVPAETAPAEEAPETTPADGKAAEGAALATRQQQVADKFIELERLLLRMAELTAPTDPRRAKLLRQAVAQSKERAIDQQFEELVALLRQERLSTVVKNQGEVQGELVKLLELLLSEDRSKRLETEKERVREYLKRVNKLIKEQKSIQNSTERDDDGRELADRQGELSKEAKKLADDVRKDDPSKSPGGEGDEKSAPQDTAPKDDKPKAGEPAEPKKDESKKEESKDQEKDQEESDKKATEKPEKEQKPGEPEKSAEKDEKKADGDKKSDGDKKPDGESKPSEKSPGESPESKSPEGPPKDGESTPQPGKPSESAPSESQQNPTQQRLDKAQQRMEEAQKKLEEAKKSEAVEKQEQAIRELEQAKAELEEILRQLREEEMSRTLAMLEARFRKMLDAQVQIYEGTQRLDKVPEAERDRDDAIEAGRLSQKEGEIALEAEKALNVLQEEGSAVAFPEAVMEIRDDMHTVRDRLAEAKIGEMTQGVEKDIIAALEEMITALEKAQQEMQDKSKSPPPGEGGESETPLVDAIAELKMIRALQMRVNSRTQRYTEITKTEEAEEPELRGAIRKLAERQERIHKVTRDIVLGRNR